MIRTVCLLFAFTFFAAQGARLGDIALAANSVLRSLSDLSAYVLDGFAFAAEVLVGQAVGAQSPASGFHKLRLGGRVGAACSGGILGGRTALDPVHDSGAFRAAYTFLPWAALTPIAGMACFQLDGIFIGATRTADMWNMTILSLAVFLVAWAILTPAFGNHGLWASLMVFCAARAATLGTRYPALERASFGGGA